MQSVQDRSDMPPQPKDSRRRFPMLGSAGRSVVAILPFFVLGGLLFWGQRTGWRVPSFSSMKNAAESTPEDWCPEHRVPESICVECRPNVLPRPKPYGWCETHGVHECPLDHPEVSQLDKTPEVTAADRAQVERALALMPRTENSEKCRLPKRRIQFASKEAAEKVGIKTEPVWTAPITEAVKANGEVTYDQTKTARLSSRAAGAVYKVFKQVGDAVEQGEVVALVEAADVGRAKAELLHGLVQLRLKSRLVESLKEAAGSAPPRTVSETEAALSETRIRVSTAQQMLTNLGIRLDQSLSSVPEEELPDRLRFLGLPEALARTLDPKTSSGNLLPLFAPLSGTVVSRNVVAGEVVETSTVLLTVVDTRTMWLTLALRMEDLRFVSLGQPVKFKPDGSTDESTGTVFWMSSEADHETRTVKVRASLDNAKGSLRSNTFGSGRIVLREEPKAIVIPTSAVQWEGTCNVVFVRDKNYLKPDGPKVFHTRTVRIGVKHEQQTEIIVGLLKGEVVVTEGSAALRSELLRNNLGAGCDCCNK